MRQIAISIYDYNELSEESKNNAYSYWLEHIFFFDDEYKESLNKFCDIFSLKGVEYGFDEYNYYINCSTLSRYDNTLKDIKGLKLYKYLWNYYFDDLYGYRYYWSHTIGCFKNRRSRILINKDNSCVLTGSCWDYYLVKPLHDFMEHYSNEKYENTTLKELLSQCLHDFIEAMQKDYEYSISKEAFEEDINNYNTVEFYEDGTVYSWEL